MSSRHESEENFGEEEHDEELSLDGVNLFDDSGLPEDQPGMEDEGEDDDEEEDVDVIGIDDDDYDQNNRDNEHARKEGSDDSGDSKYDEEALLRRSKGLAHKPAALGDGQTVDDDEEDEEEDEQMEEEGDWNMKDDHPVLLAQTCEGAINVGAEYQAAIPGSTGPVKKSPREHEDKDTALWLPPPRRLKWAELEHFSTEAMGIHMLTLDRALYILLNSGYDFKKALDTIAARRIAREEWSETENILFRQAYALYGKDFQRIREKIPHRSLNSIVHHYYDTKKKEDYKSLVDAKIDRTAYHPEDFSNGVEGGKCNNCHETVDRLFPIEDSVQCSACALYFKLMLKYRPVHREDLPEGKRTPRKSLSKEDIEIVDDFVSMAEFKPKEPTKRHRSSDIHMGDCPIKSTKTKIHVEMREIEDELSGIHTRTARTEKEIKAQMEALANRSTFDKLRQKYGKADSDKGRARMQYTWTDEEKLVAFHCFKRYGRDFEAVAEVVGTKTPDMVKSLYGELKDDIDKFIDDAEANAKAAASADREAVPGTRKKAAVGMDDMD